MIYLGKDEKCIVFESEDGLDTDGSTVKVDESESDDDRIIEEIGMVVASIKAKLDMQDWSVKISYEPDDESGIIAEIGYSMHKEADLKVYHYRPQSIQEDMMHELMHCKIGMIRQKYEMIIDNQNRLITDLAQQQEETVVDDLTRMMMNYMKMDDGE
ncbi:hypothetical protein HQ545_02785 [Candidatus Woesearchaeota archaeon]|nr:hypothetical protein [Candidatus Woesearchaeota archaeon]